MRDSDVAIVICTYNRARSLERALESLANQQTDDLTLSIVVVDNASADDTQAVVARFAEASAIPVNVCIEPIPAVASARNRGVHEAREEWIAFFDDDQVAAPTWVQGLVNTARRTRARVVFGERLLMLSDDLIKDLPPVCRRALGELRASAEPFPYRGRITGSTGNMLIHRSVLDEIGLFSEATAEGGEDADLFRRIREHSIESWYTPEATVFHEVPAYRLGIKYFRWTSLRQGVHVARRERQSWGTLAFLAALIARVVQSLIVYCPRFVIAAVFTNRATKLASRCDLWRAEGYFRTAWAMLLPGLLPQRRFFAGLDFRDERSEFTDTPVTGVPR